jgi:hypothetical protein
MTSFLQMRGSVPIFWQQDHTGMKAKPPISIAKSDPYYSSAALHFEKVGVSSWVAMLMFGIVWRPMHLT